MRKALAQWRMVPYPPTVAKVEMVAAVLKEGEYRSASSYLGQYRADSERAGCEISGPVTPFPPTVEKIVRVVTGCTPHCANVPRGLRPLSSPSSSPLS